MSEKPPSDPAVRDSDNLTKLVESWVQGDERAFEKLIVSSYDELRSLARCHIGRHAASSTFGPTALVHETYLRLRVPRKRRLRNRKQFFCYVSQTMRRLIIDYARRRRALKHGGGRLFVHLDEAGQAPAARELSLTEMLSLQEGLRRLEKLDQRAAQVVELRFFVGLKPAEIGELLSLTPRTVRRDWATAKAFLCRELCNEKTNVEAG